MQGIDDGLTLRGWLASAQRSWREIVSVFVRAGRQLSAAHAQGLVHGDFRPDNVRVEDDGRVRVVAFGRVLAGTPGYEAPEQHLGQIVDARCDQFSYCVALHEALWGERPSPRTRTSKSGVATHVPDHVERVVRRGLAVDPARRFVSMDALLAALTGSSARRRRHLAIAAALVATLAIVVWQIERMVS